MSSENDYDYKILVHGDILSGKSCLVHRYLSDAYPYPKETFRHKIYNKTISVGDKSYKFQIVDTGHNRKTTPNDPCSEPSGVLILFDVTNDEALDNLKEKIEWIKQQNSAEIIITVVAAKIDDEENRVIDTENAKSIAENHGFSYIEASSKNNINVDECFNNIMLKIIEKFEPAETKIVHNDDAPVPVENTIQTNMKTRAVKSNKCCIML